MEIYLTKGNYEGGRRLITLARAGCLRFGLSHRGFGTPVDSPCGVCTTNNHSELHVFNDCALTKPALKALQLKYFGLSFPDGSISSNQWTSLLGSWSLNSSYHVDVMRGFLKECNLAIKELL